MKIAKSEDC